MSSVLLITLIGIFIVIILFQISRISENVGILKGDENVQEENNQIMGFLLLVLLVIGLPLMIYSVFVFEPRFLTSIGVSSEHGALIDSMFNWSVFWTGIVFLVTQVLLFWFAFKYRGTKTRKAFFYPDNLKLEVAWTVIPTIVLVGLAIVGIQSWYTIFKEMPEGTMIVEVTGKQFDWIIRYPGKDGKLGDKLYTEITPENQLGQLWNDKKNHDDIFTNELHLVVGKPVLVKINARDVLHSFYLPHFRVKMDAVPGMPTQFGFTPTETTELLIERTNNPDFEFILACAELCGSSHFAMSKTVIVETQEEFDEWISKQTPYYEAFVKGKEGDKGTAEETEEEKQEESKKISASLTEH